MTREDRLAGVITGVGLAVAGICSIEDLLAPPKGIDNGFDPASRLYDRKIHHKDRASRLALVAAEEALDDAGLLTGSRTTSGSRRFAGDQERVAVVVSSNLGNLDSVCQFTDTIHRETVRRLRPRGLPHTSANAIAGWIAIEYGLQGPNITVCNGSTGGLDALFWAQNLIAALRADVVVVVGVEPDNEVVRRLYGIDGAGLCLDGAAAIVVESAQYVDRRAAISRAMLAGYGRAADPVTAARAAQRSGSWTVDLVLASALVQSKDLVPAGTPTLDLGARLGRCSGGLGVLQAAAAVARLDCGNAEAVLAVIKDEDGDPPGLDQAAALLFARRLTVSDNGPLASGVV